MSDAYNQSNQSDLSPPSPVSELLASAEARIRNSLRPGQQQMADWQGGPLAVSAVPGAGKSTGMAAAAAIAIARQYARGRRNRQLVVVTFTRSAAANIKAKIRQYLREYFSLPPSGFVVHTLHGLALNIASRYPDLSGLQLDAVTLITPNQGHRLIRTCVEQWIAKHPGQYSRLIEGMQFDGEETERLRRQSVLRTEILPELATTVINEAKSSGLSVEQLRDLSQQTSDLYGILSIAARLYEQYQNLMRSGDFIDYDDMIVAALRVLENDSARRNEQKQVFAIFEDEAQDSTPLQTKLLEILATDSPEAGETGTGVREQGGDKGSQRCAGIPRRQFPTVPTPVREDSSVRGFSPPWKLSVGFPPPLGVASGNQRAGLGTVEATGVDMGTDLFASSRLPITHYPLPNLVRVGDPNQAINSTFTPADPIYFREFCRECELVDRLATMDQAGRSTKTIIDAANFALEWVNSQHRGNGWVTDATDKLSVDSLNNLSATSVTHPLLPFRPQRIRPTDNYDPQPNANPAPVGRGVELYIPRDIYHTVELLCSRVIELFAQDTNKSAAVLVRENRQGRWLAEQLIPICSKHNIKVEDVGHSDRISHVPAEILAILQFLDRPHSPDYLKAALLVLVGRRLIETQDLNALASQPEQFLYPGPLDPPQSEPVLRARYICRTLLRARLELPHYQLISFLALTLLYDQAELATADKLTERVNQQISGDSSLLNMLSVLSEIVISERFEPVDTEDSEARYTRTGQLTIITMHKAKGLDWDYVFLPFLHENLIPGRFWVPPQRQFLGDFTLSEVARAQIRASLHGQGNLPSIGTAWEEAKHLKIAEEYRLLYVAMTRAKQLLWMSAAEKAPFTWSKPDNLQASAACPVFGALYKQFPQFRLPRSEETGISEESTKELS
jgi:DNA helicase-2/ATP-dependent DNA helicase PcrA